MGAPPFFHVVFSRDCHHNFVITVACGHASFGDFIQLTIRERSIEPLSVTMHSIVQTP
jgi:hypothetical protein